MKRTLLLLALFAAALSASAAGSVTNLRVSGLDAPLGIDWTPSFSWQILSDTRAWTQSAYEINMKNADTDETVWQSGKVASNQQSGIAYEGATLQSRTRYIWTVTVYDDSDTALPSASSFFETAFMDADEWMAQWIGKPDMKQAQGVKVYAVGQSTRYLRIDATKLGLAASTDATGYYLQLAEVEIYSGGRNLATTATFTASDIMTWGESWLLANINDGIISGGTHLGYTSSKQTSQDFHVYVTADLGEAIQVDSLVLYPRQDDYGTDGRHVANFPTCYTILTSTDGANWATLYSATDEECPKWQDATLNVPMLQRTFSLESGKQVARARIYASALGVFTMQMNGRPVTDHWLEPGETEYAKSVLYCTYDVTDLLNPGQANTWTAELAGGIFNVTALANRYTKPEIHNAGDCALRAELWIDYADGTAERLLTDGQWQWTQSPTMGSNWWGGEDYDATMLPENGHVRQWHAVEVVDTPRCTVLGLTAPVGTLKARRHAPVGVVETWTAQSVTPLSDGSYMVDFGRNFAGTYTFSLKGERGQTIQLREFETLNADGTGRQYNYYSSNSVTYDQYTFGGQDAEEQWGPRFMYHGFRYLQVSGLAEAPLPSQFTALRLRSRLDSTGTFTTSNQLLNDIHTLCHDAIGSQLYNSVTDCPQREKLGWLDVPNEMFNSLCYNFDMQAFFEKVLMDCFDAQKADGCVNSTVPHYMQVYDDDPNWGGAAILVPYRCWQTYGDETLMQRYYPQMKRLMDYYTSLTNGYLMPGSSYSVLSDWGQSSAGLAHETPTEFTITCTYYHLLNCMSEMAAQLGRAADAATFSSLATKTRDAFNKAFYGNRTSSTYDYGNQAELGMALYYGLVMPRHEQAVAQALADKVAADDYRIRTGEIGLKPVLMSLAKYGYNEVVYRMANQTDYPSYGYWVAQGCTTTPEYWDMTRSDNSQNHCMMDHIEEWFFAHLAGLRPAARGFSQLDIAPWMPADMTTLQASTETVAGRVAISWEREDSDGCTFRVSIPANTSATLRLPLLGGNCVTENGEPLAAGHHGVVAVEYAADSATIVLGSGIYTLHVGKSCGGGITSIHPSRGDAKADKRGVSKPPRKRF